MSVQLCVTPPYSEALSAVQVLNTAMHVQRYTLGRALRPLNVTVVLLGCWYVCSGVILNYGSVCCGYGALA